MYRETLKIKQLKQKQKVYQKQIKSQMIRIRDRDRHKVFYLDRWSDKQIHLEKDSQNPRQIESWVDG